VVPLFPVVLADRVIPLYLCYLGILEILVDLLDPERLLILEILVDHLLDPARLEGPVVLDHLVLQDLVDLETLWGLELLVVLLTDLSDLAHPSVQSTLVDLHHLVVLCPVVLVALANLEGQVIP
jgi:hypothetical protein